MAPEVLLTVQEVAEQLGVGVRTVRRYGRDGELPHYRIGRCNKYKQTDVDALVARSRRGE